MNRVNRNILISSVLISIDTIISCEYDNNNGINYETNQILTNWSNTHSINPLRIYEPKSTQEIARLLQYHTSINEKIRPIGSCLSPNGIGFNNNKNLLSLALLDRIVVDKDNMLVTVGAGARVSEVLKELKKYNLTLENFSSIQEQQIGGWTQVSAHGTGITLPTVDEMITELTVALPSGGIIKLNPYNNPKLFNYIKVGLGSLGVVTELTLKCIPTIYLHENLNVKSKKSIDEGHVNRLKSFRHVRYMWIPYTDTVVVVTSNPTDRLKDIINPSSNQPTRHLTSLLHRINPSIDTNRLNSLSFSQLRDMLLDYDPLNVHHIKEVNQAEANFWKSSVGSRVDDSTNILGFDCGGEQWVLEVCLPIGTADNVNNNDLIFVKKLLDVIETSNIPAPSPIEQRWTASSNSPMSPAYSTNKEIFTWVGIIMYLPPNQTDKQRIDITESFQRYCQLIHPLVKEFNGSIHWAKIEISKDEKNLNELKELLHQRYNIKEFNQLRKSLDPSNILSNQLIDKLFDDKI